MKFALPHVGAQQVLASASVQLKPAHVLVVSVAMPARAQVDAIVAHDAAQHWGSVQLRMGFRWGASAGAAQVARQVGSGHAANIK